ncbi:DYM [Blepharisma stoltei]|uniref:Dymeclin n=1 Tax=Blepharisma stoltei TaxID=1481888 RepID=A0AAU9JUP4_9CILI|nr:unnamed protein product [Blepharisma stoltei]
MGNTLGDMVKQESKELQWNLLQSDAFYLELTSNTFQDRTPQDICKSVIKNSQKIEWIWQIMQKITQSWNTPNLVINLMLMLKHFFLFVFSEGIPYQFLFHHRAENHVENHDSSFHRLVPCHLTYKGEGRTIYISVPQSLTYEKQKEQAYLIETIKSNFPQVNDHITRTNERIYMVDDDGRNADIDDIYRHYNAESAEDVLSDPFKRSTKIYSIFKANINTTECDMDSPMSIFLKELIENLANSDTDKEIHKMQTGINLLLILLSSQLYYVEKPISKLRYSSFKPSPVIDILMNQPIEIGQQFIWKLLEVTIKYWKIEMPKLGYLSVLWNNNLKKLRMDESVYVAPRQALSLFLFLQGYYRAKNPFSMRNWEISWNEIGRLVSEQIENSMILLLFYNLSAHNPSFQTYLLSLTEPERFLEPMACYLYSAPKDCFRLYLTLITIHRLANDRNFIKFINNDVILQQIPWLQDFHIDSISLGSLLYLGLIKIYRENIRGTKDEYLHVISSSCLFFLAEFSVNLHEIPSMELLNIIKALVVKHNKLIAAETPASEIDANKDLIYLSIDILTKILFSTYTTNSYLLYAILHHSELFTKLKESDLLSTNIEIINEIISYLLAHIETENIMEGINTFCKTFKFSRAPEYLIFKDITSIQFFEEGRRWEECIIPYLWAETVNGLITLPNMEKILLFKV